MVFVFDRTKRPAKKASPPIASIHQNPACFRLRDGDPSPRTPCIDRSVGTCATVARGSLPGKRRMLSRYFGVVRSCRDRRARAPYMRTRFPATYPCCGRTPPPPPIHAESVLRCFGPDECRLFIGQPASAVEAKKNKSTSPQRHTRYFCAERTDVRKRVRTRSASSARPT